MIDRPRKPDQFNVGRYVMKLATQLVDKNTRLRRGVLPPPQHFRFEHRLLPSHWLHLKIADPQAGPNRARVDIWYVNLGQPTKPLWMGRNREQELLFSYHLQHKLTLPQYIGATVTEAIYSVTDLPRDLRDPAQSFLDKLIRLTSENSQ